MRVWFCVTKVCCSFCVFVCLFVCLFVSFVDVVGVGVVVCLCCLLFCLVMLRYALVAVGAVCCDCFDFILSGMYVFVSLFCVCMLLWCDGGTVVCVVALVFVVVCCVCSAVSVV